jgi:2-keto-4-pentenoate hydratase/2-oxohepta-3-ene-1,7-dioic acid hydratase in catechol pathway
MLHRVNLFVQAGFSSKQGTEQIVANWVRFEHAGVEEFGLIDPESGRIEVHEGDLFTNPVAVGQQRRLGEVRLLVPVRPGKFIGLWNNYHELAAKLGASIPQEPLFFLKATTSLLPSGGVIRPPADYAGKVAYEGELGIVIGRRCRDVSEADAAQGIFGYTCVNDVTALDLLSADPAFPQWARAKSCDSFGPCGPVIATGLDPAALRIRTVLNGRERQNYPAADMIIPPARIVSLLSREMTLEPGDLIACGTSVGVLPMRAGMVVEVIIDGIGILRNTVASSTDASTPSA